MQNLYKNYLNCSNLPAPIGPFANSKHEFTLDGKRENLDRIPPKQTQWRDLHMNKKSVCKRFSIKGASVKRKEQWEVNLNLRKKEKLEHGYLFGVAVGKTMGVRFIEIEILHSSILPFL